MLQLSICWWFIWTVQWAVSGRYEPRKQGRVGAQDRRVSILLSHNTASVHACSLKFVSVSVWFEELNNQHSYFNHPKIWINSFKLVNDMSESITLIMLHLSKLRKAYMKPLISLIIICLLIIIEKFPKHYSFSLPLSVFVLGFAFVLFCFLIEYIFILSIYKTVVQTYKTIFFYFYFEIIHFK